MSITALVLTYNEERHIARCIENAKRFASQVIVVDSCSSDNTVGICESMGVRVLQGDFGTFAEKLNWCLGSIDFETPWVLRLDADEIASPKMVDQIVSQLSKVQVDVTGVYLRRQIWFMGRWLQFGGVYPRLHLRVWRPGVVMCEIRELDEHMILLRGRAANFDLDIIDYPLINIVEWSQKHLRYAQSEARAIGGANQSNDQDLLSQRDLPRSLGRVRFFKSKIFYRLPLFYRAGFYFVFRYFFKLGFLDGTPGLIFHFLHAYWYRFLVDAIVWEEDHKCEK